MSNTLTESKPTEGDSSWGKLGPKFSARLSMSTTCETGRQFEPSATLSPEPSLVSRTEQLPKNEHAPNSDTPSGQAKSPSLTPVTSAGTSYHSADIITTIPSLLMCDGSAQPVMVALTPSDRRLIAAAPDLLAAAEQVACHFEEWDVEEHAFIGCEMLRAAIAKARS